MTQSPLRVLIAGESWIVNATHQKGVDAFSTVTYGFGHTWLVEALTKGGIEPIHLPGHLVPTDFPTSADELSHYDVVVLSDIGSNSLLLSPDTFERSAPRPNRLAVLRNWVRDGGALIMIGGYLTFQGFEAKARYGGSPVEELLPVTMLAGDDRVEAPEGLHPHCAAGDHSIVSGLMGEWPLVLGYNRLIAKPGADVLAQIGDDPLLVAWQYGTGRSVAFASDCAPHWLTTDFLSWDGYYRLWTQMVQWVASRTRS